MFNLPRLRKALRHTETPDPHALWAEVLRIAVSTNPYPTSFKIRALLAIEGNDIKDLMGMAGECVSQKYDTPDMHYLYHQFASLVRKYPFPPELSGINPTEVAKRKFAAAEWRCKRYNQLIRARKSTGRDPFAVYIYHMRNYIEYVLGSTPNVGRILSRCDFTPGASIGVHGNATNLARKLMSESWTVNPSAAPLAFRAIMGNPQIVELLLRIENPEQPFVCYDPLRVEAAIRKRVKYVGYDKISFVLKDAGTDRTISIQSLLGSFVQKGVDVEMRSRLLRVGIDLRDQSLNQEMAYEGSMGGCDPYCTADLTSASDLNCYELVRDTFPPMWFDLLDSLRCKYYDDGSGTIKKYQKFVTMGNGFCFPLQTMLYASVCHAVSVVLGVKPDFRVYGDDIICRKSVFDEVIRVLKGLGHQPNMKKTFSEGSFRESCGQDWFAGVNVRAIYITKPLDSWGRIYTLHNASLRRESHVRDYFEYVRNFLYEIVPRSVRCVAYHDPRLDPDGATVFEDGWGESETIDGALWVPFDVFQSGAYTGWNMWTQSWKYVSLLTVPTRDPLFLPQKCKVTGEDEPEGSEDGDPLIFLVAALRGASSSTPFTTRYSARTKPIVINDDVGHRPPTGASVPASLA